MLIAGLWHRPCGRFEWLLLALAGVAALAAVLATEFPPDKPGPDCGAGTAGFIVVVVDDVDLVGVVAVEQASPQAIMRMRARHGKT